MSLMTMLLALTVGPSEPAPAAISTDLARIARRLGLTDDEIASVEAGRVVTRVLESREAGDLTIAAVLYVRSPMPAPLERLAEIRQLLTVGDPLQSGLFKRSAAARGPGRAALQPA